MFSQVSIFDDICPREFGSCDENSSNIILKKQNYFQSLPVIFDHKMDIMRRRKDLFVEQSMISGSVHFIKHVPMRLTRSRLSCPLQSDINQVSGLHIQNIHRRRESFLYKCETDSAISPERLSTQASSITGESVSNGCIEDIIVTPFAQILAVLHRVRNNVSEMSFNQILKGTSENENSKDDIGESNLINRNLETIRGKEILFMVDWCLENLENIQTDRSVSNLANVKFKKMLNAELQQYDEDSNSDHQIADYICNTFLDDCFEQENNLNDKIYSSFNGKINQNDESYSEIENREDIYFPILGIPHAEESKLQKILETSLDSWGMDLFSMHKISNNILTMITYAIFKNRQIIQTFKIPVDTLVKFLIKIESTYKDLPYHNSIHAADVIQTANVMLQSNSLRNVFTDLEIFSVLFACSIHDVDHPGLTNQYLINTSDQLATLYNDQSVLENHHLATTFAILKDKNYDILINLTKPERSTFRKLVIDMVLATDMSRHMNILADLKTMVETKKVSGTGLLDMDKYNDRVTILQNLVHCADLSNPTKPINIYEQWVSRIMEEFFIQGDKEKEMGLEVSAMCDRETAAIEKTQVGFIDYIVHPLWESWCELVYPEAQLVLDTLSENRHFYCGRLCSSQTINEEELESKYEEES